MNSKEDNKTIKNRINVYFATKVLLDCMKYIIQIFQQLVVKALVLMEISKLII